LYIDCIANKKNSSVNCFFVTSSIIYSAIATRDTISLTTKSYNSTLKILNAQII